MTRALARRFPFTFTSPSICTSPPIRPSSFAPRVGRQVDTILRMSELTVEAMPRLRSPESLADFWIEINRLENMGDKAHRKLTVEILEEYATDPITALRLLLVVEALEAAINAFETVADTIEGIAVKES